MSVLTDAVSQQHRAVNVNFGMHVLLPETLMLVREARDFNPFGGSGHVLGARNVIMRFRKPHGRFQMI